MGESSFKKVLELGCVFRVLGFLIVIIIYLGV